MQIVASEAEGTAETTLKVNLRHTILGYVARQVIRAAFRLVHGSDKPLTYRLPGGVSIKLHPVGEIVEFLFIPGLFEAAELKLVSNFLRPGMRVVDVGANVGLYSILAQKLVGAEGKVWAFEPSQESYDRLIANLKLNDTTQVETIKVALTNVPNQTMTLSSDPGYGDAYRYLSRSENSTAAATAVETVRATTLDEFAKEHDINNVDLIKIDVEGGEFSVLSGAKQFLTDNEKIVIMFESEADWCERSGCRPEDAFDLLRSLGFQLFAFDKAHHVWLSDPESITKAGTVWASRQDLGRLACFNSGEDNR